MKQLLMLSFIMLVFSVQAQQSPCLTNEAYRQFDFWLGEWDVYNGIKLAGTNEVKLILDSCVVMENWASAGSAYRGKSFNYYDPATGKWSQTWVDNRGKYLQFDGERIDNQLRYTATSTDTNGNTIHHKMTFTINDDGSVRQYWRSSQVQGEWKVLFDGLYIPKGAEINDYQK